MNSTRVFLREKSSNDTWVNSNKVGKDNMWFLEDNSKIYFLGLNELLRWLIGGKISVCVGHLMDEDWFLKLFRAVEHRKTSEIGVKSENWKKYT